MRSIPIIGSTPTFTKHNLSLLPNELFKEIHYLVDETPEEELGDEPTVLDLGRDDSSVSLFLKGLVASDEEQGLVLFI